MLGPSSLKFSWPGSRSGATPVVHLSQGCAGPLHNKKIVAVTSLFGSIATNSSGIDVTLQGDMTRGSQGCRDAEAEALPRTPFPLLADWTAPEGFSYTRPLMRSTARAAPTRASRCSQKGQSSSASDKAACIAARTASDGSKVPKEVDMANTG